jgi:hypothetical protein
MDLARQFRREMGEVMGVDVLQWSDSVFSSKTRLVLITQNRIKLFRKP